MAQKPPLRAVIIDNDETTGSYAILFAIIHTLHQIPNIKMSCVATILQRLGTWMIRNHVFRPGLRMFLQTILQLKLENKIDTVIMYTNQKDGHPPDSYIETEDDFLPVLWSVPLCIAYMFCYLMGDNVVNMILSRPANHIQLSNGIILKHWYRILEQFPDRPYDIRSMIFIDDLACPAYISAVGISKSATAPSCWHRVEPYTRILSDREIYSCLEVCFKDFFKTDDLYDCVYAHYIKYMPRTTSTPNARPMLNACNALQDKFGYVQLPSEIPSPVSS
jgi:hypothetical protein